jgi:hypothetical protein
MPHERSANVANKSNLVKTPSIKDPCIIPLINELNGANVKCLADNGLHYVCGYFLKKIRQWHECTVCDKVLLAGSGSTKKQIVYNSQKVY